jgi:hypothetical protein
MRRIVGVLLFIAFTSGAVFAQRPSGSMHDEAVIDLLKLIGVERNMEVAVESMADVMTKNNPMLLPFRDVVVEWAKKYVSWEAVGPQLIKAYKEAFTEAEIREVIAFYQTPTGQKVLVKIPELMQKGFAIGVGVSEAHAEELQRMLLDRARELETAPAKKP